MDKSILEIEQAKGYANLKEESYSYLPHLH